MRRARQPRLQGATTKARPVSIVLGAKAPCDEAERRPTRARSDPRPARVCDRAPAPPAPAGLAGLCVTSYASARVWPASRRSRIYGHEYLVFVLILLAVHATERPGWAQVTTAVIAGTIRDSTGAVLPGAVVRVSNLESGLQRAIESDSAGRYRFQSLPVGRYEIRVELRGFETGVWKNVALDVGQSAVHDFVLKIGGL